MSCVIVRSAALLARLAVIAAVLAVAAPDAAATVILFSDDFADGNTNGWSFASGTTWSVAGGEFSNGGVNYDGTVAAAFIDGVTTPTQFHIEVDLRALSSASGFGHLGFIWGVPAGATYSLANDSYNTIYLRTHADHITHFSVVNGSAITERVLNIGPSLELNTSYHLALDVDYVARSMTTTISGGGLSTQSATYTGADFDAINRNTGGRIGLISWSDPLRYDNFVLSVPGDPVPEPASLALGALVAAALGLRLRRRPPAAR